MVRIFISAPFMIVRKLPSTWGNNLSAYLTCNHSVKKKTVKEGKRRNVCNWCPDGLLSHIATEVQKRERALWLGLVGEEDEVCAQLERWGLGSSKAG